VCVTRWYVLEKMRILVHWSRLPFVFRTVRARTELWDHVPAARGPTVNQLHEALPLTSSSCTPRSRRPPPPTHCAAQYCANSGVRAFASAAVHVVLSAAFICSYTWNLRWTHRDHRDNTAAAPADSHLGPSRATTMARLSTPH
jgi:hypothetical protein